MEPRGGTPIAPEILLGMLVYGYATGIFSSRGLEKASYESMPVRFIAGNLHPDHDTIANFRSRFLEQIKELFVQILEMAVAANVLKVEDISVDGTKIHADASKSKAVSHKRLEEIQMQLRTEVEKLIKLGQKADGIKIDKEVDVVAEIARRKERLAHLEKAKQELHNRAQEQYELDQSKYVEKMAERAAYIEKTGKKPSGRVPSPPFLPSPIERNTISPILNHGS
ncbi:transposase [Chamaesiphon minutus]|uniref:transposase n=1 Tax=Chamaesiphon minutus TaxID=1173032 RepID=UPI000687F826|nr:transposase [Chamaesiphon minutus]